MKKKPVKPKIKKPKVQRVNNLIPDTSVIIEGILSRRIKQGKIIVKKIIIHEAVLAELEHQSNRNKEIGFIGLEELRKIKEMTKQYKYLVEFAGRKPSIGEIKYAKLGGIDSLIRDLAYETSSTLITADAVQAKVAETKGIPTIFIKITLGKRKIKIEKFFDDKTMSVHIKEGVSVFAKKGMPGKWSFVEVRGRATTREEVKKIASEIVEEASIRVDGFIEIERRGSSIIQLGRYRIVITKPPFADGWEITAVKPVKKLSLKDYNLNEKLNNRISEKAEGILVAGAPGMGKSTFAQGLAEFYASKNKIVKTIEAPRDLILPNSITQYAISHGSNQELHDILLLSRPDYTIFDEMRNTSDFKLFADMRLSGVGMVGIVHATNPIDAIQRFVGRIELGVIPQIIDTVIFIKNGVVNKVLSLHMIVKVPSGMTEADLARPVVVVNDFETEKLEYELYSYGEETVVIPVTIDKETPATKLASRQIEAEFKNYSSQAKVEMLSAHKCIVYVPERDISKIIGRQGKNIDKIEKAIGISINVEPLSDKQPKASSSRAAFNTVVKNSSILFEVGPELINQNVDISVGGDYLLTVKVSKASHIKIKKNNKIGKILLKAVNLGELIELKPAN